MMTRPRRKPAPEPRKSRSGPTQPETARTARQVLLRLRPETTRALDALAERRGLTRSDAVTELVETASDDRSKGE